MFPSSTKTSATDMDAAPTSWGPPVIRDAGAADIAACRELFRQYERSIGVSLCLQGFERELAELPGDYVPPRGGLWIASIEGEPAGCVALRPIDEQAAEMKRLYVRSQHPGRRPGLALARHVIQAAAP